jgi:membrane protein DedA with SNARE-associated domain
MKILSLRAELLLKHPIFLILAATICVSLQIWISYVSAHSILEGELITGLSLFLLVPMLGLLLVVYYLWFRRQRAPKPLK